MDDQRQYFSGRRTESKRRLRQHKGVFSQQGSGKLLCGNSITDVRFNVQYTMVNVHLSMVNC